MPNKERKAKNERKELRREKVKQSNKNRRLPRPMGITFLAIEGYGTQLSDILTNHKNKTIRDNNTNNQQHTNKQIKYRVVEQWVHQSMSINNQYMTINQLSIYLNLDVVHIQRYMDLAMKKIGKWLGDDQGMLERSRAIFFTSLNLASENMALNRAQVELLTRSQSGRYKPFISSTLNQALANNTSAMRPFLDLIKVLEPKQNGNTIFDNRTINLTKNQQYLTTEEALILIGKNAESMALNPSLADAYILTQKGLPDVGARTQDLKAIGIKYDGTQPAKDGPTILSPTIHEDSENGPNPTDHHINRGGKAFEGKVEDEDDFRM